MVPEVKVFIQNADSREQYVAQKEICENMGWIKY